ncbi:hypothetical protein ABIF86_000196 [Bradyrhizobium japonicum]
MRQLDRAGAGLPAPIAVAVALDLSFLALLAVRGSGQALDLQLHQPVGGKADHLAQEISIGGLLYERAQVHHVVGHRWFLESGWLSQSKHYRRIIDDHPQSRSLATALYESALRERLC